MKKIFTTAIILLTQMVFGQETKIDSLLSILNKNPNNVQVLIELSNISRKSDLDKARVYAKRVLDIGEKDNNKFAIIKGYHLLAAQTYMDGRYNESIKYYEKLLKNLPRDSASYRGIVYLDIANVKYQQQNSLIALEYGAKADSIIDKSDSKMLSRLYLMYANIYHDLTDFDKAIYYAEKALIIAKQNKDKGRELRIRNTIGNIYDASKNKKKAIQVYKAIISDMNYEAISSTDKSIWYYNLAATYNKVDSLEKADFYNHKAFIQIKDDIDNFMHSFIVLLNGDLKLKQGNVYEAIDDFKKARKMFADKNMYGRVASNDLLLGQAYNKLNLDNLSINSYKNAIRVFEENGLKNELTQGYQEISEVYEKNKNYEQSLNYYKLFKEISDSINQEKKIKAQNLGFIKYQTAQKETQLLEQQLKIERQKTYTYLSLAGLGLFLILGGGGYAYNKHKQRQKEFLRKQEFDQLQNNMTKLGLSNLNNQINSHDFKNTLSAALNEVQEKAPKSYNHISNLLKITESALYSDSFTDSLKNQLIQIKGLVELSKAQFFEEVTLEIHNELEEDIEIPRLLLKNLVENSLKHGISGTGKEARIQVSIEKVDHFFSLKVQDTGKGLNQHPFKKGKGLAIYQELFNHFNKKNEYKATFDIKNVKDGVLVIVKIPINYEYS